MCIRSTRWVYILLPVIGLAGCSGRQVAWKQPNVNPPSRLFAWASDGARDLPSGMSNEKELLLDARSVQRPGTRRQTDTAPDLVSVVSRSIDRSYAEWTDSREPTLEPDHIDPGVPTQPDSGISGEGDGGSDADTAVGAVLSGKIAEEALNLRLKVAILEARLATADGAGKKSLTTRLEDARRVLALTEPAVTPKAATGPVPSRTEPPGDLLAPSRATSVVRPRVHLPGGDVDRPVDPPARPAPARSRGSIDTESLGASEQARLAALDGACASLDQAAGRLRARARRR